MAIPVMELQLQISGPEGTRRFKNAEKGLLRFARDLEQAVSFREINPILLRVINSFLHAVADAMVRRHSTPWQPRVTLPTGDAHGRLAKRSGQALRDIEKSIKVLDGRTAGVTGFIGGPFYLVTQEEGRTITKSNGYMAIPLEDALDQRGVPIRPGPRSYENTFIRPLRSGDGFIILQRAGAQIKALYVLKKTVKIPPRLGMGETIKFGTRAMIEKMFNAITIHVAQKAITGRNVNPAGFI